MGGRNSPENAQSMQTQAKAMISGIKQEVYSREHPPSKKVASDSSKSKISLIAVYFSDTTGDDIFAGPVVDTYLQCTKSEVGIVIPYIYKEHIVPLFLSLPWSYREFTKLGKQPQVKVIDEM